MARTKSTAPGAIASTATIGFEAKLWLTADKLRNNMDAAECNGARPEGLLGLIFPGAGLEIAWGPAARDFGRGQGGEAGASPQRAVTAEPTPATGKRPAARKGFVEKAGWLRCSSVRDRCGYPPSSRLAIQPFPRKQDSHGISRPAPEYISDTFEEHRAKLLAGKGDYKGANAEDPDEPSGARQPAAGSPKGERGSANQYKAENVFWVPADARWSHLQGSAKLPTIGKTVDDAMVAIERDNRRLKGVLPKDYARPGLDTARRDSALSPRAATPQSLSAAKDNQRLGELIDVIATISLTAASEGEKTHRSVDLLGRVYEYFLTRFASAEGKNGGQFYTPSCVVRCLVEPVPVRKDLAPYKGRIYDPACGSGPAVAGFVQSEKFVEAHGGRLGDIQSAIVEVKTSRHRSRLRPRARRHLPPRPLQRFPISNPLSQCRLIP